MRTNCKQNTVLAIIHVMSNAGCSQLLLASWILQASGLIMPSALAAMSEPLFVEKFSKYAFENEEMHHIKKSMLRHVGFDSLPVFSREDIANFEVPYHMKKKYEDLKSKHEERHRIKRSSLAALFKSVHDNPGK